MEKSGISDCNSLPWSYFCSWTVCQLLYLGPTFKWSDPIHNNVVRWCNVVWNILSIGLYRLLFWLSNATIWTTCPNKSNSSSGSYADMVHASCALHIGCWSFTLWCLFYRAVLHFFSHLWKPILLPVRVFISCLHHSGSFLQSNKVSQRHNYTIRGNYLEFVNIIFN